MPTLHIVTGNELHPKVTECLLSAPEIRDERCKLYVDQQLVEGKIDFYKPIRKLFLATGVEKKPQVQKVITVLTQHRQAFGTLLSV